MKTAAIVVIALVATTAFLALTPTAEAKQVCTFADSTCDGDVCAWDRVNSEWACVTVIDPCWFRCY